MCRHPGASHPRIRWRAVRGGTALSGWMMVGNFGALVLALPLAATFAASAQAQPYPTRDPYYSSVRPGPPPGYQLDPNDPEVAIRRPSRSAQDPRPGFIYSEESDATPASAPQFGQGRQADPQADPKVDPKVDPRADLRDAPNAMRPPRS